MNNLFHFLSIIWRISIWSFFSISSDKSTSFVAFWPVNDILHQQHFPVHTDQEDHRAAPNNRENLPSQHQGEHRAKTEIKPGRETQKWKKTKRQTITRTGHKLEHLRIWQQEKGQLLMRPGFLPYSSLLCYFALTPNATLQNSLQLLTIIESLLSLKQLHRVSIWSHARRTLNWPYSTQWDGQAISKMLVGCGTPVSQQSSRW